MGVAPLALTLMDVVTEGSSLRFSSGAVIVRPAGAVAFTLEVVVGIPPSLEVDSFFLREERMLLMCMFMCT